MSKRKRTRKAARESGGMVMGVAWYRREEWPKLLAAAADRGQLEDTYDEWLLSAEQLLSQLSAKGIELKKVDIDVDALIAWCRDKQLPLDGEARSRYVSEILAR
jgi:hypothetical protein